MATKKIILKFDMELETEEREGYFAARTKPFAITTYGDTELAAEERATQAVLFLVRQYAETPNKLVDFLTHRGVKHIVHEEVKETERHFPIVRSSKREMQVEVLAGV